MIMGQRGRTCSEYLCQDALLVGTVNVIRGFSCFVGTVQQAAIFGVPQQQFSQFSAASTDGNVERCVPFLD